MYVWGRPGPQMPWGCRSEVWGPAGMGPGAHPQPSALDLPNTLLDDERHLAGGLFPLHQQRQGQPEDAGLGCARCFLLL